MPRRPDGCGFGRGLGTEQTEPWGFWMQFHSCTVNVGLYLRRIDRHPKSIARTVNTMVFIHKAYTNYNICTVHFR